MSTASPSVDTREDSASGREQQRQMAAERKAAREAAREATRQAHARTVARQAAVERRRQRRRRAEPTQLGVLLLRWLTADGREMAGWGPTRIGAAFGVSSAYIRRLRNNGVITAERASWYIREAILEYDYPTCVVVVDPITEASFIEEVLVLPCAPARRGEA